MTDEKIINEEILDDADLENVAGGTLKELVYDAATLLELGEFYWKASYTATQVSGVIRNLGKELGLDITCNYWDTKANIYKINGKKISHDEFWSIVKESLAAKKN